MERLHGAVTNSTEKINIKQYFEDFSKLLTPVEYGNLNEIFFEKKQLGLLKETCSIDHLGFAGEPVPSKSEKDAAEKAANIPEDTELETLRELMKKYKSREGKKNEGYIKYQREIPIRYETSDKIKEGAVPGQDIFVSIRVYKPYSSDSSCEAKLRLSSLIVMLGNQTLDKLRDKINCISDLTIAEEISEDPRGGDRGVANRDIYKSGFFFIEEIFYNDMRNETNMDNSAVIRKWAEAKGMGKFGIARMEDTRVDSLAVRFGYPWVYQHQGTCEHLIVFSDARLVHPDDDLDISHYPKIERVKPTRFHLCMLCNARPVHWIVTESDRVPHDPCYFCEQCFMSFNYIDGRKLGTFKAYRYPYDPVISKSCVEESTQKEEDSDSQ
ncbi:snRNA-activating protein complex subunit 3 [Diachasma alloeum]|uniref:snRNA-activating protein complex subunit 3 n=1 Tax=Diachasma alloeum TaxID=454923 RepID=UPI0010FAF74E|nr:snRNA-activating protein complex subunit 3 [Diachasma alloeum]